MAFPECFLHLMNSVACHREARWRAVAIQQNPQPNLFSRER
jgi:hypothetical protein